MVRTFFALGGLMLCLGLFSCYDENGTYAVSYTHLTLPTICSV